MLEEWLWFIISRTKIHLFSSVWLLFQMCVLILKYPKQLCKLTLQTEDSCFRCAIFFRIFCTIEKMREKIPSLNYKLKHSFNTFNACEDWRTSVDFVKFNLKSELALSYNLLDTLFIHCQEWQQKCSIS